MAKLNCWEFMKCGREPGGVKNNELGICPASIEGRTDGIHGGANGGRACWAIAGTFCGDKIQGTFARKFEDCMKCEFYRGVMNEEIANYKTVKFILGYLK